MFIAKVTGSLVSTQKVAAMTGYKLLIVEPYRIEPKDRDSTVTPSCAFVAVDMTGPGIGDCVLLTQGSAARVAPETKSRPSDAVVVGICDSVNGENNPVYAREKH